MKNSYYLSLFVNDENNVVLQKKKFNIHIKNKYECSSCPICLSVFSEDSKDDLIYLQCGHKYCFTCLDTNKKQNRTKKYVCPMCKFENVKGYIVDINNNIKSTIKIKNVEEDPKKLKCHKCCEDIDSKYFVICEECKISYHGYCLKNYTNKMIDACFICPNFQLSYFQDEKFICDICMDYETHLKQNLERHRLQCQKYKCNHCNKVFKTKILLKSHQKETGKLERVNKLMEFMRNSEKNSLNSLMNQIQIEENHKTQKSEISQNNGLMGTLEMMKEINPKKKIRTNN